MIKLSTPQY
jgi:hypothetical protein